ncbi:MAG: hypothetical protein ACW99V_01465 [Candidatus Thorarchaeota archaeon]|jgi:hypothetical protein
MKVKLKVEARWLDLERKSMFRIKRDFETWESQTLQKAKDAKDLRSLREVFYQMGDRWEWDQATGAWLSDGEPLDAIGLILKMPGLGPNKERFVVYGVMAYSKGFTNHFDHLGDKERIIIERDIETGAMVGWSTSGHGAMDLIPTDLSMFSSIDEVLTNCILVAQPGDHALRLEIPPQLRNRSSLGLIFHRLWEIAGGNKEFYIREIDVLNSHDIEERLDFRFHRYSKAVLDLEKAWEEYKSSALEKAKEVVIDRIPDYIEDRNKSTLRMIEGLLNVLWFKPPAKGISAIRSAYDELESEPTPTEMQRSLIPYLGELAYSLNDILEKAKYLKWKSVMEKKSFGQSDVFQGLNLSSLEKEAFAVALDDILKEHTLAYVGYPERATMKNKMMRTILGMSVLPLRLLSSFKTTFLGHIPTFSKERSKASEAKDESVEKEDESVEPESSND